MAVASPVVALLPCPATSSPSWPGLSRPSTPSCFFCALQGAGLATLRSAYELLTASARPARVRQRTNNNNRDRGEPHGPSPPTPPYVRASYTAVRRIKQ